MLHPPPSSTLFPYTTLFRSRADLHPRGHGGGARGGVALAALDLHQAQPAGAERLEGVGRAQLRHLDPGERRGAHDRGPFRDRDRMAVDLDRDGAGAVHGLWSAEVLVIYRVHIPPRSPYFARPRKSSRKCLSALCTGHGAMPPSPHSDPCPLVPHSSSSSRTFRPPSP